MSSTALAGNELTGTELTGTELTVELQQRGYAVAQRLLSPQDCAQLVELYAQQERFRSRIVMSRHGYGQGEYQYFGYPLPPLVAQLRQELYPQLVPVANSWSEQLGSALRYPPTHHAFLQKCRRAGQLRPTPLLLKYTAGDYNCLHQDLYGQTVFPLQLTVLLSRPGIDFTGGEFVLTEQRPRMQ
ncbi:MAG: 2OG-Fe(II) oxygenase, partial [Sinobacteraceae bacterium]|nr:2OG-Fe(II) oxygenase [Nevskiaceae bacterium]